MRDYLHVCYTVAMCSPRVGKARIAAALVYKNRLLSIGTNSAKSHPLAKEYGRNEHAIYLHAEVAAIRNALRVCDDDTIARSTLYVARAKLDKHGKWQHGLAKPCVGCARAIVEFGIQKVEWTQDVHLRELEKLCQKTRL